MNLHQQLEDYRDQRDHIAHSLGVTDIDNFQYYINSLRNDGLTFTSAKVGKLVSEFVKVSDEIERIERELNNA